MKGVGSSKLSNIELVSNNLTDKSAIAFGRILATNKTVLSSISLERNGITCVGAKALADALKVCKTLKGLNLNCI